VRRNLIFTRDLTTPLPGIAWPEGLTIQTLAAPGDGAFAALDRMYVANGFREGWATGLLKGTARVVVALDFSGEAVAAGWLLREPFYVAEIRRTFDPGPNGDYYFGDFVTPSWRGRGLQRASILHRLHLSAADGRRWAIAMTREDNAPSCNNYKAGGFAVAADLTTRLLRNFSLDQLRRLDTSRPYGHLSDRGIRLPFGYRLSRGR
jgi:hypothetical protein